MKVGILYICTGKYSIFWSSFYEACEKWFLPDVEKHYFVWTDDNEIIVNESKYNRTHIFYQELEAWPLPTLRRYHYFLSQEDELRKMDYLIYMNSNLIVQKKIKSVDIMPRDEERLFMTISPGPYANAPINFAYDRNPECSAYIPEGEGKYYLAGGFNGGHTEDYLEMARIIDERTENDYKKGVIARWHDESHINRYMIDYVKPYRLVSPAYLYPEGWNQPFECKILILDKNKLGGHDKLRKS